MLTTAAVQRRDEGHLGDAVATVDIETLTARVDQLGDMCEKLTEENADLRNRLSRAISVATPASAAPSDASEPRPVSRRGMLGKALGATAAGVAGVTLLDSGTPAAATDGDAVKAGNETLAEHETSVKYNGAGGLGDLVFLANDSTYDGHNAFFPAALGGWTGAGLQAGAGGVTNGIYGYTEYSAGHAVVGYQAPRDSGIGGAGVYGLTDASTNGAAAVLGEARSFKAGPMSAGVRGANHGVGADGIGVHGSHAGSGWGVYGTAVNGRGGVFSGPQAAVQLKPGQRKTHPKAGSRGDLYVDRRGRLWFCKFGGAHATWKQLA